MQHLAGGLSGRSGKVVSLCLGVRTSRMVCFSADAGQHWRAWEPGLEESGTASGWNDTDEKEQRRSG